MDDKKDKTKEKEMMNHDFIWEGTSTTAIVLRAVMSLGVGARFTVADISRMIESKVDSRGISGILRKYSGIYVLKVGRAPNKLGHIYQVTKVIE